MSYNRRDNETYDGVVDRLKADLAGRFEAETGRPLKIFVDRDDIPGGGDWREKIASSIASATIFIPVISMRYFASNACREELLAFYDGADRLGVTQLILPVILAGRGNISSDDPRPEVQLIERLNYRAIDEAVDCGYQSAEWKTAVRQLVTDIARALEGAETSIAQSEGVTASARVGDGPSVPGTRSVQHSPGVEPGEGPAPEEETDIFVLRENFDELTELTNEALEALQGFGSAATEQKSEIDRLPHLNAQQQRAVLVRLAGRLRPSSEKLGEKGRAFESTVRRTDRNLRGIVGELGALDGEYADSMRASLVNPLSSIEDMEDTLKSMDGMANMLTALSVMNVSLRKALQPSIQGIKSVRNGISIATSWRGLESE